MAPLRLALVAYISPQNHPILLRTFSKQDELKYHYIAHTSLDIVEERMNSAAKGYLGLLYALEDVAVYGYITALKVKIILAFTLSDTVIRDGDVVTIFKAVHMAYYSAISNPFLKLDATTDVTNYQSPFLLVGGMKWKGLRKRIDEISKLVGGS